MGSNRVRTKASRASVACARCRLRKVRCDVSRRGHPCGNCEVDEEQCVVLPRSRSSRVQIGTVVTAEDSSFPSRLSSPDGQSPHTENEDHHQQARGGNSKRIVDIAFQAYPFIRSDFFTRLGQDEICYLDSQSCFRLPTRTSWNSLIQVYFRHIHPLVPVLDEAKFWEATLGTRLPTLSLFVVQAILFAACPFAGRRTIQACGFENCREARVGFYRRAKWLYRLESETQPLSIIQGSLILSLCSSPQTENPVNSIWLGIAIQHARSIGAHHLQPRKSESLDWLELKRLWWVCLSRDRIISLGYRRPLQIVDCSMDAELDLISSSQVCDEMCRTEMYSDPVRRALFFVFLSLVRLSGPLARILTLATPASNNYSDALRQAKECTESLQTWIDDTIVHFELFDSEVRSHPLVLLHYHLLQIYFHVASVHILNFKIMAIGPSPTVDPEHTDELVQSANQIETSVAAIANNLSILAEQHLVEYMPNGAIMCTVLPFVLNAVHAKLLPPKQQTEATRKRSEVFLKSMNALRARRNHVNPITDVIEQVVTSAEPRQPTSDGGERVALQPEYYLRVMQTLDLVVSTGKLPSESEKLYSLTTPSPVITCSDSSEAMGSTPAVNEMNLLQPLDPMNQLPDLPKVIERASEGPSDNSLYDSIWLTQDISSGLGAQMADSRPSYPILRDIFGLCQDQDIDALLNMI